MRRGERGQAMIETAISLLAFLAVTAGLVDAGRGIAAYNEVSAVARYGARWASVVGGSCGTATALGNSTSDWCDQLSNSSSGFWSQAGNKPLAVGGSQCPAAYSSWYKVSDFNTSTATTIVGAIARHFDSNSSTPNTVVGFFSPGLDYSKLLVCVRVSGSTVLDANGNPLPPEPGDVVTVQIYYPFQPAGHLLTNATMNLTASADWQVEG